MNRTLEDYLRTFTQDGWDRWDEMLTMVELSMNNAVNVSTSETPFFLNYGKDYVTPEHPRVWQSADIGEHTLRRV